MTLTHDGQSFAGRVVQIVEGGLTAAFPPGERVGLTDTEIAGVVEDEVTRLSLAHLEIQARTECDATLELVVTTRHDVTRTALRHLVARYPGLNPSHAAAHEAMRETLPRIPLRGHYTEEARLTRLAWARATTGALLSPLQHTRLDPARLTHNTENLIGAVEVPVGIAGPLRFKGEQVQGLCYAPVATTEGALIASITRGALAITRAGGVTTRVLGQRMMRAPLFELSSLHGAARFAAWLRDHQEHLRRQVGLVSRHATLVSADPVLIGRCVHVCFRYETGDAAGQNMATACTWQACTWLMQELRLDGEIKIVRFVVEGNTSGDKKIAYSSIIMGRGVRVVAEAWLSREVLKRWLDVTPEDLIFLNSSATIGAIHSGTVTYNINVANLIAGLYAATGQDIACVHESSVAILDLRPLDDGVCATMVLPCLVVGTVGGGTQLPAQHALLEMMDCAGQGKVARLAEITAGFALALDLSTACAVVSGQFAHAHDRLGRNRPVRWFCQDDLGPAFFDHALRGHFHDETIQVRSAEPLPEALGSSIIARLTVNRLKKLVGLFPMRLRLDGASLGRDQQLDVLVKSKPLDEEILVFMETMALMCGARVAAAWRRFRDFTQFRGCHVRELGVCSQTDPRFTAHAPVIYGVLRDDTREAFVLTMERLHDVVLLDCVDSPEAWTAPVIEAALRGIAEVHAIWLGREEELRQQPWLGPTPTAKDMRAMTDLWEAFAIQTAEDLPELVPPEALARQRAAITILGTWWPLLESMPRTLVHNDFNPRNLAFRGRGDDLTLVAYDWELATLHVPQHDLAELLAFVLTPAATAGEVTHYVEVHRRALEAASGARLDPQQWRLGYALSLKDLVINRFAFYLAAHSLGDHKFLARALPTLHHLLRLEEEAGR
ncbi:MAG TPA: phosphotransferase [Polyangia bacterium]